MSHDTLIILHATCGVLSFVTGILVILPGTGGNISLQTLFKVFLSALVLMLVLLIAVIIVDWAGPDKRQQVIFGGLGILGLYMVWRAFQAYQLLITRPEGWQLQYTAHVGFNLISLFEGFVIVAAIDLGAPGWLVGRWLVHMASSRFVRLTL